MLACGVLSTSTVTLAALAAVYAIFLEEESLWLLLLACVCVCVAIFIVGKHLPLGCSEREGGELTTSCVQLQLILFSSFLSLFMAWCLCIPNLTGVLSF